MYVRHESPDCMNNVEKNYKNITNCIINASNMFDFSRYL